MKNYNRRERPTERADLEYSVCGGRRYPLHGDVHLRHGSRLILKGYTQGIPRESFFLIDRLLGAVGFDSKIRKHVEVIPASISASERGRPKRIPVHTNPRNGQLASARHMRGVSRVRMEQIGSVAFNQAQAQKRPAPG